MFQQPFTPFDPSCKGVTLEGPYMLGVVCKLDSPFACNSAMMSSVMK